MDWNAAVDKNREALKQILAMLVAMAGLGDRQSVVGNRQSGSAQVADGLDTPDCLLPTADCLPTLPRHLYRAVLRLLRPAEAAVRRLIIVAARGIVVSPPPPRSAWSPSPASQGRINGDAGTTWILPRSRGRGTAEGGGGGTTMRPLTLPLFDPLPRWGRRARPRPSGVPRISVPGFTQPFPIRLPSPDDPVDAARLAQRFTALASALDDLPGQARRFARWRARRDALRVQIRQGRHTGRAGRAWPLRPGRPPGGRRKPVHEVHEVLNVVHGLAFWVLNSPDTS
jgi:hypothetical protein